MQMTVRDLMSQRPVTIRSSATIKEAVVTLLKNEIAQLYVVDQADRVIGVVPDYALLKWQMGADAGDECVETLTSRSITTVGPDMPIEHVSASFRESQHQQMPVVEEGRILGLIGRRDVMRLLTVTRALDETTDDAEGAKTSGASPLRGPRFMTTHRQVIEIGQHG